MKNSNLENLAAEIVTVETERDKLAVLIDARSASRMKIEASINAAQASLNVALTALETAGVRDALGEGEVGELVSARAGVFEAEKSLNAARKHEVEARELATVEQGLAARLRPLDETLIGLRTQHAHEVREWKITSVEIELHEAISQYTSLAEKTMAALARAMACHQALDAAGRSPDLLNPGLASTVFGSFSGYPLKGNGADMLRAERARIDAALR